MKNLLLGCIALSAFATLPAYAQMTAPATAPSQITDAFEIGLLYRGFNTTQDLKVKSTSDGFVVGIPPVTIGEGKNITKLPAKDVTLTRVNDFGKYAQYKISETTFPYLKALFGTMFPTGTMSHAVATEDILFVPALKLRTKQSLHAEKLTLNTGDGIVTTFENIFYDALVGNKGDKIDSAASFEIRNFNLQSKLFSLIIPNITATTQMLDSAMTADPVEQFLTASLQQGELSIPEITVVPQSALIKPLKLKSNVKINSVQNPITHNIDVTLQSEKEFLGVSAKDFEKNNVPSVFPQKIKLNVTLTGLNADAVRSVLGLQEQVDNSLDEDAPSTLELKSKIQEQAANLINNLHLKVSNVSMENPLGSIRFSGVANMINNTPEFDGALTIVNFDRLSPDYKKQCDTEKKKQPKEISSLPMSCYQFGVLDPLRAYLPTAKKSSEKGKTTHVFTIRFEQDQLLINGKPFQMTPDADDKSVTPVVYEAMPTPQPVKTSAKGA